MPKQAVKLFTVEAARFCFGRKEALHQKFSYTTGSHEM